MKKITSSIILSAAIVGLSAFAPVLTKLSTNKSHVQFFSTTAVENIEAHNYKSVSTIDVKTGDVVFSIPMQSFEFDKALMQKHFNSAKFLDTKQFPKAKLLAKISNISEINFEKDGVYSANIKGDLSMHGKTNPVNEKATVTVRLGAIKVHAKFKITLADYDVAFEKGKPSSNIAKTVEVTVDADFVPLN